MHYLNLYVLLTYLLTYTIKVKIWVLVIALLTRLEQQRFTISEVAADWHELMLPWRIMRPSIARDGEQLDSRCSIQTYHRPNQRSRPSSRSYYSFLVPLRVGG